VKLPVSYLWGSIFVLWWRSTVARRTHHKGGAHAPRSAHRLATVLVAAALISPADCAPPSPRPTSAPPHHAAGVACRTSAAPSNINVKLGGYAAPASFTSIAASPGPSPSGHCNSTGDLYAPLGAASPATSSSTVRDRRRDRLILGRRRLQAWYEMYPADGRYLSSSSYPVRPATALPPRDLSPAAATYTLAISDTTAAGATRPTRRPRRSASTPRPSFDRRPGNVPEFAPHLPA